MAARALFGTRAWVGAKALREWAARLYQFFGAEAKHPSCSQSPFSLQFFDKDFEGQTLSVYVLWMLGHHYVPCLRPDNNFCNAWGYGKFCLNFHGACSHGFPPHFHGLLTSCTNGPITYIPYRCPPCLEKLSVLLLGGVGGQWTKNGA